MTRRRGFGGLSDQMKSSLTGAARKPAARPAAGSAAPARPGRKRPGFEELPEYRDFKTQRAVADMLGVTIPFYRSHEGRAGATALIDGRRHINFASYDYCALNGRPELAAAATAAMERYGMSASASRVVAGERDIHRKLEEGIARFLGVDDAVIFVSGHATNVSLIGRLLRPDDLLIHDALIHNSVLVGAQLAGCARRSFAHNDLAALEAQLDEAAAHHERILVVVEGHYSMDGDVPDLARLVEIKERYGAWLMVDEAHGLGVLGRTGRGIAEQAGIDPRRVDIWMGTLSKTLAGCGGFVAGSPALVEYLKLTAPSFVYSVGMPPPVAAACLAALEILDREPELVARVNANARLFLDLAREAGLDTGTSEGWAIVPVMVGDSLRATALASRLLERGINALPILYPAVPERAARLRFFFTAEHTEAQIREAVAVTAEELAALAHSGLGIRAVAALAKATRGTDAPGR
jgi:8-amino-7-oxononanoate synthase